MIKTYVVLNDTASISANLQLRTRADRLVLNMDACTIASAFTGLILENVSLSLCIARVIVIRGVTLEQRLIGH